MKSEIKISSVIELLGFENKFNITNTSSNNVCPKCGDVNARFPKKKLNINFRKDVFRCNKCGWSGNALTFWSEYRGLEGCDSKAIAKDYYSVAEDKGYTRIDRKNLKRTNLTSKESPIADSETINRTYRALLGMLYLSKEHKESLLARGFNEKAIEEGMYKTYPSKMGIIVKTLAKKGYTLKGVPGFYKKNGEWTFVNYGDGFLIPCFDLDGRICNLQLRKDTKREGETRYFTISSADKPDGTKGTTRPAFVLSSGSPKKVIITEGPLKGALIAHFTGYSVLSVLGVNSLVAVNEYLRQLKRDGVSEAIIAYDMDIREKKGVQKGKEKLEHLISNAGISYKTAEWDENYKGLDDYLLYKRLKERN